MSATGRIAQPAARPGRRAIQTAEGKTQKTGLGPVFMRCLLVDTTGQPLRRPEALSDRKFLTTSQIPTNETMGTASNASTIYVGGFRLFTIYMRESVSIQLLKELHAETGEVGFICHTRLDVASAYPKAFTLIDGVTADE